MRKIILAVVIILINLTTSFNSSGNPIIICVPTVQITGFSFGDSTHWHLGVRIRENSIPAGVISIGSLVDSIVLGCSSGRQTIWDFTRSGNAKSDCFFDAFNTDTCGCSFNLDQDELWVFTYYTQLAQFAGAPWVGLTHLNWGTPSSLFPVLKIGEIIKYADMSETGAIGYNYKSPSTFSSFDASKITIKGYVYDAYNNKISGVPLWFNVNSLCTILWGSFIDWFKLFPFEWSADSSYTSGLLARNGNVTRLICIDSGYYGSVTMVPVTFYAEPGDTLWIDLHITDSTFYVSTPEVLSQPVVPLYYCSPNPFGNQMNVYFQPHGKPKDYLVRIANSLGRVVYSKRLECFDGERLVVKREEVGNSGVYFLSVYDENGRVQTETVVMR